MVMVAPGYADGPVANTAMPDRGKEGSKPPDFERAMDQLNGWLEREFKKCQEARYAIERTWYSNLAFYRGDHWFTVINTTASPSGYVLKTTNAPPWRVRRTINKIRTIVRTEIAKLTSSKPTFTVTPASNEDDDLAAAKVANQLFEAAYYNEQMVQTVTELSFWVSTVGNGFVKTYWDPFKPGDNKGESGDVVIETINPFFLFFPDMLCIDIEKQPYIIHAITKPKETVKAMYGIEDAPTMDIEDLYKQSQTTGNSVGQVIRDQVLIKEFWIKPGICPALSKGGFVTVVGNDITQIVPGSPYNHGKYPFAHVRHVLTGSFYGASLIEDLKQPQQEYNRINSQIIENRNLSARYKLLAAKGSVDPNKITDEPGQIVEYNPGFNPPVVMQPFVFPSYVMEHLNLVIKDMDDISGIHDISRGVSSADLTAASAIAYLQEADNAKLGPVTHSLELALEKIGTQYLKLITQFWDAQRTVAVVGKDLAVSTFMLKGSDLKGNTDVRVEAGSGLPYSKAAKQAFLMDLVKMGAIQPGDILGVLEVKGLEKIIEDNNISLNQIRRENIKMSQGMEVPVNAYDIHELHLELHNRFRRSEEYEILQDQMKMLFENHCRTHEYAIQQKAQQQMQAQLEAQGGGGSPSSGGSGGEQATPPEMAAPGQGNPGPTEQAIPTQEQPQPPPQQ
jgi:hypothetical protein